MKKLLTLLPFITFLSFAQTPTIEPAFFAADEEITITFDVTGTSLQSQNEAWIWMWLPEKSIDAPSNVNPANSNTSATDPAKCTRTTDGSGRVFFSITLTPTTFYNQPAADIESIGMLLKGNDWANGQTDDHIVEISNGFSLVLESPTESFGFFSSTQDITISAITSEAAEIDILIDDISVESGSGITALSHVHTIISDGAVHEVKVTATNGTDSDEKTYSYTLEPTPIVESLPAGVRNGINYIDNTSATLVLEAPNKDHVFVIGDFNDWSINADYQMKQDGDYFWLTLTGLTDGQEYLFQYLVDGSIRIADPYAEKISSQFDDGAIISEEKYENLLAYPNGKTSEAVSFLQTNKPAFDWSPFERPANEDLVIYELLIRDFTEERSYEAVTARLDYLQDLGINALELMPVQEFEGNISWGYNPSSMFAFDKYYGTELDLKTLINEAHKRGIAVILDIVLNHQFGRNSLVRLYNEGLYGQPTAENPWFNVTAKHDFNVGYDMNHESGQTETYSDRVVEYWLEEYNIDGYRFDLSKGFTQVQSLGNINLWGSYDASRVAIWKRIADVIWNVDPTAYIILEHFADNTEEKELANYGMMLWGNLNDTYRRAAGGNSTSLSWIYHVARGWDNPHVVGYMESHDEERLVWDLINDGESETEAVNRAKLAAAFFLPVPGPKMIWQFGEFGYDEELNNDRLGIKPTRWEYLEDDSRKRLFDQYKSLIHLRTKTSHINKENFEWSTSGRIKWITIDNDDVDIHIIGNFDNEAETGTYNFTSPGTWFNYFTGEEFIVEVANQEVTLAPGQFFMYTSELIDNYIDDGPIILGVEGNNYSIEIYPNPTSQVLTFQTQETVTNISIKDLNGRTQMKHETLAENQLNIEGLPVGVFILEFNLNGQKVIKKIIKN